MPDYAGLILGGGPAGLDLALRLATTFEDQTWALIEPGYDRSFDPPLSYWAGQDVILDEFAEASWRQARVELPGKSKVAETKPYHLGMVRLSVLKTGYRAKLERRPNVELIQGKVETVQSQDDGVIVTLPGKREFTARHAFDGRGLERPAPDLWMRTTNWEITTAEATWDAACPIWMDWRSGADDSFFYLLPLSATRAIIQQVWYHPAHSPLSSDAGELESYLQDTWQLTESDNQFLGHGKLPLFLPDPALERRQGNLLLIGDRAHLVKPSSGYGLMPILRDNAAIVASLSAHQHPFALPVTPARFDFYDRALLQALLEGRCTLRQFMEPLLKHQKLPSLWRFLDERSNLLTEFWLGLGLPFGVALALIRAGLSKPRD